MRKKPALTTATLETRIGLLIDILPPSHTPPDIDNDYSIGILVQPNPLGADYAQVSASEPFGYLVKEQAATHDIGLLFTRQSQLDHQFPGHPELEKRSEVLHCEFEGRAIYDMFLASRAAILPLVAGLFVCLIPGLGWLAAILAALGIVIVGGGYALWLVDSGDPTDVTPNIGELHTKRREPSGRRHAHHQGALALRFGTSS